MNKEQQTKATKLAQDHWAYVRTTLAMHNIEPGIINACEHHYTTGLVHGYKHGIEDTVEEFKQRWIKRKAEAYDIGSSGGANKDNEERPAPSLEKVTKANDEPVTPGP